MNVVFVCTGNTCRSPLAESLARKIATERGLRNVTFSSAGTNTVIGSAATDGAILVGLERDIDLSRHRSRPLDAALATDDTLFLALSESHLGAIHHIAPHARAMLLDEFATRGKEHRSVPDPFGGELSEYRAAADTIEAMLDRALDRLVAEQPPEVR